MKKEDVINDLNNIAAYISIKLNSEDVGKMLDHLSNLAALGGNMAQAGGRAKILADREMAYQLVEIKKRYKEMGDKLEFLSILYQYYSSSRFECFRTCFPS